MSTQFCLTVRFLDSYFHGRGDGEEVEWPPSPMRVFQALITAAARLGRGHPEQAAVKAFEWLEGLDAAPVIVAPKARPTAGYSAAVPNNAMDIMGRAWSRGSESAEANPSTIKTLKRIRPVFLEGEAVHYLWAIPGGGAEHVETLSRTARSISALGWGIDVVVGGAALVTAEEADGLAGERWLPSGNGTGGLRVPVKDSYADLEARHAGFLARMGPQGFAAPPALTAYQKVEYRRATEATARPIAAFNILKPDGSGFRAYDAARKALTVAGMTRGAARAAAERSGWSEAKIAAFVLGHGAGEDPARFAYIPLPSVEVRGEAGSRRIGDVRRVLLTSFRGACREEFAWARRNLSGQELVPEGSAEATALLALLPESDSMVQRYLHKAAEWATVTPVVLPGFDDPAHLRRRLEHERDSTQQKALLEKLNSRIDGLLRKAIVQAGFSTELARCCEIEWRASGFWAGVEMADRYGVPDHLKKFPRYHVRILWRDRNGEAARVTGPVCIGGGRFYGAGLFAGVD